MNIIYHCYGGAHSSVTAAAVHLGWLPTDRIPETEEFQRLPYFDRPVAKDHGRIRLMGKDELGNDIYVLGRRNSARIFENMAQGLLDVYNVPAEEFQFYDVMPYVNWKMMLGGFSSRKIGATFLGRPIITIGTKHSYWKIVTLVHRVKILQLKGGGGNQ